MLDRSDDPATPLITPTGSGKTLAYLLPLLERIDASTKDLQLAVLSPTQELAVQIHDCIRTLEKDNEPAIRSQLLIDNIVWEAK